MVAFPACSGQRLTLCPLFCHSSFHPPFFHSSPSSLHDSVIIFHTVCPPMASHCMWKKKSKLLPWLASPLMVWSLSTSANSSPPTLLLIRMARLVSLEYVNHSPAPGPLHMLFPLPRILFPTSRGSCPTHQSCLSFSLSSSERPSLTIPTRVATFPFSHSLIFFTAPSTGFSPAH